MVFECEICFPVEGILLSCVAKNITKAGIRAESATETPSPVVIFIARDHHFNNKLFSEITISIIEAMGPTFIKFGQVLSSRPDLLPEFFITFFLF